jgi:hypothetical protein
MHIECHRMPLDKLLIYKARKESYRAGCVDNAAFAVSIMPECDIIVTECYRTVERYAGGYCGLLGEGE